MNRTPVIQLYRIKKFRYPRDPLLNMDWTQPSQYAVKSAIAFFSMMNRRRIPVDFIFTNRVLGIANSTKIDEEVMIRLLGSVKNGSTEIPVHPGNYDKEQINDAYASLTYASAYFCHAEKEKRALLSEKVRGFIAENDFMLISYKDL